MKKLFGTDGIRGEANIYPMDADTAVAVGRAVATYLKAERNRRRIVIGQDTRISGDMLAHAVAAGICSAGIDADLLGVIPTPAVARLIIETKAAAGVVISASHNSFEDNGIKVFNGRGCKLSDAVEKDIEAMLARSTDKTPESGEIGRIRDIDDSGARYVDFLHKAAPEMNLKGMTIVLDCANGATYQVAPTLFEKLEAKVIPLSCTPDGLNINDACGSEHPEHLARAVVTHQANIGLAFDGDGDRLIAVDENGTILTGDQVMAVCAQDLIQKHKLKNNLVISTVMSNLGFHQALEQMGARSMTTQVGDRYVIEKMLAEDAVLGGEDSGHMIFRDVHTTGDGMMAALRLIDAIRSAGRPLSQLSGIMRPYPQELINVDIQSKPALETVPEIQHAISAAEKVLGKQGRVLVRYSGTQNKCRVMVEGPTEEQTRVQCRSIADVVRQVLN